MGNYSLPRFVNEFYKKSFFEHSLFGFVTALKLKSGLTTSEAVKEYLVFMNIEEDEAAYRSVYARYYKLLEEYRAIPGGERITKEIIEDA